MNPSPNPELERVKQQISLIVSHAQANMKPDQAQSLVLATGVILKKYETAVNILVDDAAKPPEKKLAKDVTDSINKNLPRLTKGVLSAASAFKANDYIGGSAAIMDICASGAQMLGSLSAAAGPYGAAFGAVFTLVGQLLTFFGAKQKTDLKQQIEDAIRGLDADNRLQTAAADGDSVEEYTETIYRVTSSLPRHLKQPLQTEKEIRAFRKNLEADLISIHEGWTKVRAQYGKWGTARWLQDPKTQAHDKWPEILGVFCRVYSDSLLANMALASMVDPELVEQRLDECSKKNPNYEKAPHDFDEVNNLLISLSSVVEALPDVWNDGNRQMLQALKKIKPVAQQRGLFLHLGTSRYLYAATGQKTQSDSWPDLPIGYGGRGHRFSITVPKEDRGSLKPQYHLFFCEHWFGSNGGGMEHGRVKPAPVEISGQGPISPDKFSDVWALPAPEEKGRDEGASFIYAAHDGGTSGYVKLFELDEKNQLTNGNWMPATKSGVMNVRAITHPPATLPDDPDRDGMPPGSSLLGGVDHYNSIVYGALRSSSEIYVDQSNTRCYVPSPWATYTGIDVDPYYLWVFRPEGFACATHASVISCIQGKRKTPRWMEHSPAGILGDQSSQGANNFWWVDGQETKPRPPLKGVTSFSACKDGTLFVNAYNRTVSKTDAGDHFVFEAKDTPGLYTAAYSIDLKAGRINVDPWMKCGGVGLQVQKMAIPCWSQLESLTAVLEEKLNLKDVQSKLKAQARKAKGKAQ